MATVVFLHAHPDDEALATGGTMARMADDGHRVVLVVATRGEEGEPVPGVLADGEDLADRRGNSRGVVGDVASGNDLDAGLFTDPVLVRNVAVVDVDAVGRIRC